MAKPASLVATATFLHGQITIWAVLKPYQPFHYSGRLIVIPLMGSDNPQYHG